MDLYQQLGVQRDATLQQIKKAYRKLATKHHPDKNDGDKASEEKFKEINNAHAILSDEKTRKLYDLGGMDAVKAEQQGGHSGGFPAGFSFGFNPGFEHFFGRSAGGFERQQPSGDINFEVGLTPRDLYNGVTKRFKINQTVLCTKCDANGTDNGQSKEACAKCEGQGTYIRRIIMDGIATGVRSRCSECRGSGEQPVEEANQCRTCKGKGTTTKKKKITFEVRPRSKIGLCQVVRGAGDEVKGCPTGSVNFIYAPKPDPDSPFGFATKDHHLILEVGISWYETLTGTKQTVDFLDGSPLTIKQDGPIVDDQIVIMPGYGTAADQPLLVKFKVNYDLPTSILRKLKKLLPSSNHRVVEDATTPRLVSLEEYQARQQRRQPHPRFF